MESLGLSPLFLLLVLRSIGVTFAQATLSVLAIFFGAAIVAFSITIQNNRLRRKLSSLFSLCGDFAIVLPGLSAALWVLQLSRMSPLVPSQGLWAIVFAHTLLFIFFITGLLLKALAAFLRDGGSEQVEAALLLGAPRKAILSGQLKTPFLKVFKTWGPLIFLWCFNAFTTVVILGGGPRWSSPEVLLFYSLQGDLGSNRVLVLALFQTILALGMSFLSLNFLGSWQSIQSSGDGLENLNWNWSLQSRLWNKKAKLLGLAILLVAFIPLLILVAGPLVQVVGAVDAPPENFLEALKNSLLLATTAAFLSATFTALIFFASARVRHLLLYFMGISTTLVGALWIHLRFEAYFEMHVPLQIVLAATLMALVQLPLFSLWIINRRDSLAPYLWEAPALLGASRMQIEAKIIFPQCSDIVIKAAVVSALGALGELSLSTLVVRDGPLLSTVSQHLASRYNFSGANYVLFAMLGLSFVMFGIQKKYMGSRPML